MVEFHESSFMTVVGQAPSDAARQRMYRLKEALRLDDNDALWSVLYALEHYQALYEEMPEQLTGLLTGMLDKLQNASREGAVAAAAEARQALASAVPEAITRVARDVVGTQRATAGRKLTEPVLAAGLIFFALAGGLSVWMHHVGSKAGYAEGRAQRYEEAKHVLERAGYERGKVDGYRDAESEKAAASWGNTYEGRVAQEMARSGALMQLAQCTGKGWRRERGRCFVEPVAGHVQGWTLPNIHAARPRADDDESSNDP
jgi:hypothetical protein